MTFFARLASLAVLLVAASHGSGQAIQPAEIVLPYQADVQNHLVSAVVQADGSWLASGHADAALNITFEQSGDVRQIEHVRAPFITDFDYGFPGGSEWHREVSGQLVQFDYLQNVDEFGLYNSGCRIRVAPPSRIDFYSAACGEIGITGENAYLWFRISGAVSRLIRRVDGVELWNLRFFDIPNYGRFSGAGAVFTSDGALVYGKSSLAGPIAMKIDRDGNTQWIHVFPSPSGGFAQGQFAAASFDPMRQQFVFWLNETDESVSPPRLSSRMYWLSLSGPIQRSNTTVPRPLSFAGASAIVLQDAPARLERIDGEFGTVLWSQPTATPLTAVCHDRSAIYVSTAPAQPSPNETATIEKLEIADGAVAYRQTVASSGPVQSLFCDQGQAFLQTAAIDEPRIAPVLTKFSAQGLVQWQRPFPAVPHEVNHVHLASNQHGDMVVELGLNRNYVALPIRYQLSRELVRGYTQAGDRFEFPLPRSTVLANDGSLTRVVVTDTKEDFDYRFEQRDAQGNLRWQVASPYRSQMRVAQSRDGVAWFSPEGASTEFGFPVYSVTPQGVLRTDQMQGDRIGNWVNVGDAVEAVVNEGKAVKVVRMAAGSAPSYGLIPGLFGTAQISERGDVFTLSQPSQFPASTSVKKYQRLSLVDQATRQISHQFAWELAVNTEVSALAPDATGGVWVKAVGRDPEPFISAAHINANGQLLSASNFNTRIIFENQACAITELQPVGTGALGFGSIIGGGCVFWLDARGVVVDGALLPGTLIKQIAYSTSKSEVINVLAQRQNAQGLFEVVVQAVQRSNFRDGFD